jgi:hypothetical protein
LPETSSATGQALPWEADTIPAELDTTHTQGPEEQSGTPVMPTPPPFPNFENTPTLPHQLPGNGYESGRDSRAR